MTGEYLIPLVIVFGVGFLFFGVPSASRKKSEMPGSFQSDARNKISNKKKNKKKARKNSEDASVSNNTQSMDEGSVSNISQTGAKSKNKNHPLDHKVSLDVKNDELKTDVSSIKSKKVTIPQLALKASSDAAQHKTDESIKSFKKSKSQQLDLKASPEIVKIEEQKTNPVIKKAKNFQNHKLDREHATNLDAPQIVGKYLADDSWTEVKYARVLKLPSPTTASTTTIPKINKKAYIPPPVQAEEQIDVDFEPLSNEIQLEETFDTPRIVGKILHEDSWTEVKHSRVPKISSSSSIASSNLSNPRKKVLAPEEMTKKQRENARKQERIKAAKMEEDAEVGVRRKAHQKDRDAVRLNEILHNKNTVKASGSTWQAEAGNMWE